MKYYFFLFIIVFFSCKKEVKPTIASKQFNQVEVEIIFKDSTASIRAIEIINTDDFTFATSTGKIGLGIVIDDEVNVKYVSNLKKDSITPNFRAVAYNGKSVFAMSIATPALLYKDNQLVYIENHKKAFYDSMEFWNEKEGIAIGDPTADCLSIVVTRDAGESWQKISCDQLPKINEGEAAFAASDTNIAIIGDSTWIATGGKSSRVLFSSDKGVTWQVFNTPIVQGLETTGMYSMTFYDALNGFAIGGNYLKPETNVANKICTIDGGKTWQIVGGNQKPGYRSCIQYVPNSNAKSLVAIGFKGIDVSHNAGKTWQHLSDESFYTLRFVNDSIAYAAGNGRISKLNFN